MTPGSEPRFRIRIDDGSEIAVPSLEALARRIDRGEILPDTELFDAGTNEWTPSRRSPVVRFILEERELEGFDPLEAWEGVFDDLEPEAAGEEGVEPAEDEDAEPAEVDAVDGSAPTEEPTEAIEVEGPRGERGPDDEGEDPFDLGLTLEPGTFEEGRGEDDAEVGDEHLAGTEAPDGVSSAEPTSSGPSEFESFTLGDDFGATDDEEGEDPDPTDDAVESEPAATEDPDALPLLHFPDDDEPPRARPGGADAGSGVPDPAGGTSLDEWAAPSGGAGAPGEPLPGPSSRPVVERPKKRPEPARRSTGARPGKSAGPARTKGGRKGLVVLAVVALLAAGVYAFGDRIPLGDRAPDVGAGEEADAAAPGGTEMPPGPGLVGEDLGGVADVPPVPDELGPAVERALRAVRVRFDAVVDSLRVVHGMGTQPPREWLSGPYVAQASEFPSVRDFWSGYEQLVAELRGRDPELFLETALRAVSGPDPERNSAAERYLEERYRSIVQLRRARYAQLTVVARRALELHDFLEASEAQIRFTPAIGPEVPLDPILEARSEDPEVQRELLRRLDTLFQALDQTRGADQPALGGLGNDLFRRFAEG